MLMITRKSGNFGLILRQRALIPLASLAPGEREALEQLAGARESSAGYHTYLFQWEAAGEAREALVGQVPEALQALVKRAMQTAVTLRLDEA